MHTIIRNPRGPGRADVAIFPDVTAWLDAARRQGEHNVSSRRPCNGSRDTFYAGASFEDAQTLGRYGWTEGRAKMLADLEAIQIAATTTAPSRTLDVCGAVPLAPAAAAGDPLNMLASNPESTPRRRVLTLRLWIGVLSNITADTVIAWGAALASHIDALEIQGYRIELYMIACAHALHDSDHFHAVRVQIKAADQPLDIDRLAFIAAHPAAHRRINFAIREHSRVSESLYGVTVQPDACPEWLRAALDIDADAIDLPSAGAYDLSEPAAAAAKQAEIIATALDAA